MSLHLQAIFTGQGDIQELMTKIHTSDKIAVTISCASSPWEDEVELQGFSAQNALPRPGPQSVAPFNLGINATTLEQNILDFQPPGRHFKLFQILVGLQASLDVSKLDCCSLVSLLIQLLSTRARSLVRMVWLPKVERSQTEH